MQILKIYTDGGCSENGKAENFGGWGAILQYGEHKKELYGGQANTTNNRMELTAMIEALKAVKKSGQRIQIFSDSSYVVNCFLQGWHVKWKKQNWMRTPKAPVENKELWIELLSLTQQHQIEFYRVKGHVNVNSKNTNLQEHYKKFKSINGDSFSFEDYIYITTMNCRADELANIGINEAREGKAIPE